MICLFLKFGLVVEDPNCHSFRQGSTENSAPKNRIISRRECLADFLILTPQEQDNYE